MTFPSSNTQDSIVQDNFGLLLLCQAAESRAKANSEVKVSITQKAVGMAMPMDSSIRDRGIKKTQEEKIRESLPVVTTMDRKRPAGSNTDIDVVYESRKRKEPRFMNPAVESVKQVSRTVCFTMIPKSTSKTTEQYYYPVISDENEINNYFLLQALTGHVDTVNQILSWDFSKPFNKQSGQLCYGTFDINTVFEFESTKDRFDDTTILLYMLTYTQKMIVQKEVQKESRLYYQIIDAMLKQTKYIIDLEIMGKFHNTLLHMVINLNIRNFKSFEKSCLIQQVLSYSEKTKPDIINCMNDKGESALLNAVNAYNSDFFKILLGHTTRPNFSIVYDGKNIKSRVKKSGTSFLFDSGTISHYIIYKYNIILYLLSPRDVAKNRSNWVTTQKQKNNLLEMMDLLINDQPAFIWGFANINHDDSYQYAKHALPEEDPMLEKLKSLYEDERPATYMLKYPMLLESGKIVLCQKKINNPPE